jgi:hypothetical protein
LCYINIIFWPGNCLTLETFVLHDIIRWFDMRKSLASALLFATVLAAPMAVAGSANAAPISGLFNTDASLAADGAVDPNWTVNGGAPTYVYNNPLYIQPGDARWIAVQSGGGYTNATNTFSLTFDLTGFIPSTASVSGNFGGDNWADIYLNGNLLASQPHLTIFPNFESLTSFSASGVDFVNGINTFSVVVTDTGPPSALLVEFTDSSVRAATAVPEPLTLSLFGAGLAGAAAMRRRKKAAV